MQRIGNWILNLKFCRLRFDLKFEKVVHLNSATYLYSLSHTNAHCTDMIIYVRPQSSLWLCLWMEWNGVERYCSLDSSHSWQILFKISLNIFTFYIELFTFYHFLNKKIIIKQNFSLFFLIQNILTFFSHIKHICYSTVPLSIPFHSQTEPMCFRVGHFLYDWPVNLIQYSIRN